MVGSIRIEFNHRLRNDGKGVLYLVRSFKEFHDGGSKITHHRESIVKINPRWVDTDMGIIKGPSASEAAYLNELIGKKKVLWMKVMIQMEESGVQNTRGAFRDYLSKASTVAPKIYLIEDFKDYTNSKMSGSTTRLREAVLLTLQAYERVHGSLTYQSINYDFFDSWVSGLLDGSLTKRKNPLTNKTVNTYLSPLVSFMKDMLIKERHEDRRFELFKSRFNKKYKIVSKEKPVLSKEEIVEFMLYPVSSEIDKQVKDAFIVMLALGARYSDVRTLHKSEVLVEPDGSVYVDFRTRKSKKKSFSKATGLLKDLLLAYNLNCDGYFFPLLSEYSDSFSKRLKEIGRELKWNRLVSQSYTQGSELIKVTQPLCELFTSHTGRVSYSVRYMEAGGTLRGLQDHLSHSSIKTTEGYTSRFVPQGDDIDVLGRLTV